MANSCRDYDSIADHAASRSETHRESNLRENVACVRYRYRRRCHSIAGRRRTVLKKNENLLLVIVVNLLRLAIRDKYCYSNMALRIARMRDLLFSRRRYRRVAASSQGLRCLLADFIFSHQDEKMKIS